LVPFEWSVVQHRAFGNANSSSNNSRLHPMMHAPAVGTSEGIMCFGGVQLGVMQEVKVDNEVSWIKETMAGGLEPDYSKVFQVRPSHCPKSRRMVSPRCARMQPVQPHEHLTPLFFETLLTSPDEKL
jgi:hypothetical protein